MSCILRGVDGISPAAVLFFGGPCVCDFAHPRTLLGCSPYLLRHCWGAVASKALPGPPDRSVPSGTALSLVLGRVSALCMLLLLRYTEFLRSCHESLVFSLSHTQKKIPEEIGCGSNYSE